MAFGDKLRYERINKQISQEELGKKINKTKNNISQYELGKREPDHDTLKKFAEIFDCSIDYLLENSNARENINETKASYTLDTSGLPDDAIKLVEEYIELIKLKYSSDVSFKKP